MKVKISLIELPICYQNLITAVGYQAAVSAQESGT